ncbi:substrate-binding domain-containing protein [Ruixingdingia sedimenti]|uniref:Substrate-binding domain-containing protein n=1 Tax=Ruixingdingia sedimenti TaxID=3073604 RepID=A0ABU1F9H1_9RHOB|nr:substrate-binding domain-containing protein [Xinfangfangia sp. LG-4]MDR5653489.1 substrate-binding domain-containing protein [Xinfangfangia sp. LG-4]
MKRLLIATAMMTGLAAGAAHAEAKYRVAVMPFGLPEYMSAWTKEMEKHPAVADGTVAMTILDGRFDAVVQSNQMDTVITQQYDAVIFAPIDFDAAQAPVERAAAAGIPVITSVTGAAGDKYFAHIATNDVEGGRMITEELAKRLDGSGKVVIIEGPIGNSPQLLRRQGIDESLANHKGIELLASRSANWSRAEGLAVMENWLSLYGDAITGVIAENDEMGLGAMEAIRAKGLDFEKVKVVSIDGIPDALRAVEDSNLYTLYKSAHFEGQGAMDLALRAIEGEAYQPQSDIWAQMDWAGGSAHRYDVPWFPVTRETVASFK